MPRQKAPDRTKGSLIQARIAQVVAYQLGTREVLGSKPTASKIKMKEFARVEL